MSSEQKLLSFLANPPGLLPGKRLKIALSVIAIVFVVWVSANSLNYVTPYRPGPDAGQFAAGSMMLNEGKVLYKEIIADKGPGIFFLNASAFYLGDTSFYTIRIMERLFAVAGALLIFAIVFTVFRRRFLAIFASVLYCYLFYGNSIFEQGAITEEYAVVFVLAGILSTVYARQQKQNVLLFLGLSGLFFSSAVMIKAPFLFSSVAWFLYMISSTGGDWRESVRRGGWFLLGAFIPVVLFAVYLGWHSAFPDLLESFALRFAYVASDQSAFPLVTNAWRALGRLSTIVFLETYTGSILFVLGGLSLAFPSWLKKYQYFPIFALLAFVMSYLGATTSARQYGHYFLQVIPDFILFGACGGALFLDTSDRIIGDWKRGALLLLLMPGLLDYSELRDYWARLQQPFVHTETGELAGYIQHHALIDDQMWLAHGYNSRFYIETGLSSPTKYYLTYLEWFRDTEKSTVAEKIAQLKSELFEKKPAWIVLGDRQPQLGFMLSNGLVDWICENYTRIPVTGEGSHGQTAHLYISHDRALDFDLEEVNQATKDIFCFQGKSNRTLTGVISADQYHTLLNLSVDYYKGGHYQLSIETARKVLLDRPDSAIAYNNICSAYNQLGEWDKAIKACDAAIVINPDYQRAKNNLTRAVNELTKAKSMLPMDGDN